MTQKGRQEQVPDKESIPRPQANAMLFGHRAAEHAFLRALASGRLPHAWLITGTRGIGKATLAYRMARHLLVEGAPNASVAPEPVDLLFEQAPAAYDTVSPSDTLDMPAGHPIFRRVAAGAHPDLRVLERAVNEKTGRLRSEILVDDVRGIVDFLHMTPSESKWRVTIIDAAEDLNKNAANALLKILEEPRDRTAILLVSHAPGRLLPTIRSRCRRLELLPLDEPSLVRALDHFGVAIGEELKSRITYLAEGSIQRALDILEGDGENLLQRMGELFGSWPRFSTEFLHRFSDQLAARGAEQTFQIAVTLLDIWMARFVKWSTTGQDGGVELFPRETEIMARLKKAATADLWLDAWEKAHGILQQVESTNFDRKQAMLTALLALRSVGQ